MRSALRFLAGSIAVYAIATACAGEESSSSGAEQSGGSRLQTRIIKANDGAVQPLPDWFDSKRKEVCRFVQTTLDGSAWACVPVASIEIEADDSNLFADADCTSFLARTDDGQDELDKYVLLMESSGAEPHEGAKLISVFKVGDKYTGQVYWTAPTAGAECAPVSGFAGSHLTEEVPLSDFVAGAADVEP